MSLGPVQKEFYSLAELAKLWGSEVGDLIHLGGQGRAQICVNIYAMTTGIRRVRQEWPDAEEFGELGDEAEHADGGSEASWAARTTIEMPHGVFELGYEDLRVVEAQRCWPYELHVAAKFDLGSWWDCEFDPPVSIEPEHLCVLREEAERLEREVFSNEVKGHPIPSKISRPIGKAEGQKQAILKALRDCGHEPTALPRRLPGIKPWVFAEIKPMLVPTIMTLDALERRWQDLRDEGRVAEVNHPPPGVSPKKAE